MPLRTFANFKLVMSNYRKELRGALVHGLLGLCVNPSLIVITFNVIVIVIHCIVILFIRNRNRNRAGGT